MYSINGTTIKLTQGDTFRCQVCITQDGQPYELQEGDTVRFAMKRNFVSQTILLQKILPISLLLILNPEDTKELQTGEYVYELEMTFSGGDVDTFIQGKFVLTPEVQ